MPFVSNPQPTDDGFRVLRGSKEMADYAGLTPRQMQDKLAAGLVDADKHGRIYVTTVRRLRRSFGEE